MMPDFNYFHGQPSLFKFNWDDDRYDQKNWRNVERDSRVTLCEGQRDADVRVMLRQFFWWGAARIRPLGARCEPCGARWEPT